MQRLIVEDDLVLAVIGTENDALAEVGDAMIAVNGLRSGRDHRAVFAAVGLGGRQLVLRPRGVGIAAVAEIADNVVLGVAGIEHVQLCALLLHSEGEGSGVDRHRIAAAATADGGRGTHGEAAEFLRRDADGGADLADALGVNGGLGVVGVGAVRLEA